MRDSRFIYTSDGVFSAILFGLFAGLAIGKVTEHYTGTGTAGQGDCSPVALPDRRRRSLPASVLA